MKKYKTIIIGCGASGIMCAINAKGDNIAVIDVATKPGKKILVTGNGRCNLTNVNLDSSYYNQNIDKYLKRFNVNETLKFFSGIGLEYFNDEEGRVYPISNSAKSVVDVLVNKLEGKVDLYCEHRVEDVNYENGLFKIKTDKVDFMCENLVVSTGGYSLIDSIKSLNINYLTNSPSLVSLKCDNVKKELNGIKVSNVLVSATNGKESVKEMGEVLFKENGLSGIVIFNLSTIFARNNEFKGNIVIDLMPKITDKELMNKLTKRMELNIKMSKFFVGMFQNSLADEILRRAKIDTNINSDKLQVKQIEDLVKVIKNMSFNVVGCFDNNQVFSGGVDLNDLDDNLMSKKVPNLYFCGEVCDVDGVCGGYNLQWAWTSGKIVGDSL